MPSLWFLLKLIFFFNFSGIKNYSNQPHLLSCLSVFFLLPFSVAFRCLRGWLLSGSCDVLRDFSGLYSYLKTNTFWNMENKLLHWNILFTCRNVWAICVVFISLEYIVLAAHMGPTITKVFYNHPHNSLQLHFWMWNFMQVFILCFIF